MKKGVMDRKSFLKSLGKAGALRSALALTPG
jgi:hypothetical protein